MSPGQQIRARVLFSLICVVIFAVDADTKTETDSARGSLAIPPPTATVVVVGAGMAGVAAASVLAAANVSFVVLEASNRTGGRIKAEPFGDSRVARISVETGANWIHGAGPQNPVRQLALAIRLQSALVAGGTSNLSNYVVYDDQGMRAPDSKVGPIVKKFNKAFDCCNSTSCCDWLDMPFSTAMQQCGWKTGQDGVVGDTLEWEGTASDSTLPADLMSLHGTIPDGTYAFYGADDELVVDQRPRGYASVVDVVAGPALPVFFNTKLVRVDVDCDGVRLVMQGGAVTRANAVILTLPLGVLQKDHAALFANNPLSTTQVKGLHAWTRGNFTKVFGQWAVPFWDVNVSDALASAPDPILGRVFAELHNLAHPSLLPHSNVLFLAFVEPASSVLESASESDGKAIALRWLRDMFPTKVIPDPTDFLITRHGVDPLSYMAYSTAAYSLNPAVGSLRSLAFLPLAAAACPTKPKVWFAGEAACSDFNGYTQGALESGKTEAAKVLHELGLGPAPPPSLCNRAMCPVGAGRR